MLIYSNYKCDIDIELCDKVLQFIELKVNYYITIYFYPQFYKYVFTCDTIVKCENDAIIFRAIEIIYFVKCKYMEPSVMKNDILLLNSIYISM